MNMHDYLAIEIRGRAPREAPTSSSSATAAGATVAQASGVARQVVVVKFGGTSVASLAHIRRVALRVAALRQAQVDVVLVVSAMAGETNRLLGMARNLMGAPCVFETISPAARNLAREIDALAATGEQVVASLAAIALESLGHRARSFLGHQVRILTDSGFGDAAIRAVDALPLRASLRAGEVPVVAGFQGVDIEGNVTTLGRGGSDTTAVAVAAALGAMACEIFTDVDGVYEADPRREAGARKLDRLSYDAMYAMATHGAKVLHDKCVVLAAAHKLPLYVRSSFSDAAGTWIGDEPAGYPDAVRWRDLDLELTTTQTDHQGAL